MRDNHYIAIIAVLVVAVVVLIWGASKLQYALTKTDTLLTSTQDELREMSRELDATKKALQRCEAKPPKTVEYVRISSDRCGELLDECLAASQKFLDAVDRHTERVEAILR